MPRRRTKPLRALVAVASVAGLSAPGITLGVTSGGPVLSSTAIRHHIHGEQYDRYRGACYRLTFMARSIQETAGVLGALGSPVELTCGIARSLVQALEVGSERTLYLSDFSFPPHTDHGYQSPNVLGPRRIRHKTYDCNS